MIDCSHSSAALKMQLFNSIQRASTQLSVGFAGLFPTSERSQVEGVGSGGGLRYSPESLGPTISQIISLMAPDHITSPPQEMFMSSFTHIVSLITAPVYSLPAPVLTCTSLTGPGIGH